jgi:hypothetical protein
MICRDHEGIRQDLVSTSPRWARRPASVAELAGLGPTAERDAAIIALSKKCGWSVKRLSRLFDLSERWVFKILKDFRDEAEALEDEDS